MPRTSSGLTSWPTTGVPTLARRRRSAATSAAPSTATVRPSVPARASARGVPRRGRGSSRSSPAPDRRLRGQPRLEGGDPVAGVDLDPGRVGDGGGQRGRQVLGRVGRSASDVRLGTVGPSASAVVAVVEPGGVAAGRATASKSSESWSPPPSAGGRAGRAEPQPDGRADPATRAAGTEPSVADAAQRLGRVAGRLAGHRRQALDERAELVLAEQPDDRLAVVVAEPGRLEVELDRQVAHDRRQVLAHEDLLAMLDELVAQLVRLDLVDPLVQRVERPELADELGRGLLPHPGHARDVVGRVALERLVVDHLAGDQVEPLVDLRRVVEDRVLDAGSRRHQAGVVGDQLEHVQVAGHDRRVEAAALGVHGDRADDVVRLVAGQLVDGDAQRLDDLADLGELVAQVVRHPLAGRLVLGVLLVAERRALEVEGDRDVVRLDVRDAAQDDAAEAEDRVDELALRRREGREREVSAVDEPVAVEQHQAFHRQASGADAISGRGCSVTGVPPARLTVASSAVDARRSTP